jgi:hypothetical protein
MVCDRLGIDPSELSSQRGIVAELRVCIERKMIRDQAGPELEQLSCTSPFDAYQSGGLVLPKPAVVDQNRIGIPGTRRLDQGRARRHPADQPCNRALPFDLQAVRGIIVEVDGTE